MSKERWKRWVKVFSSNISVGNESRKMCNIVKKIKNKTTHCDRIKQQKDISKKDWTTKNVINILAVVLNIDIYYSRRVQQKEGSFAGHFENELEK